MAACSLFDEDLVYVNKPGKGYSFGLIVENSEYLSSGEDDEVEAVNDRLHKGTVRVLWHPTGKETVVAENKIQLLDRSLMPGDVVKRLIPGQESQCGFVMDMDVRCHLRVLSINKYIYNINSKDLIPYRKLEYGQEVMLDSWLGRIEGFDSQIILLFPDGARCQIDESDLCPFRDALEKRSRNEFYPGQELKGQMDYLSDAKWLNSTPRYCQKTANKKGKCSTIYVKIEKFVYKNVEIHWLSRGFEKGDNVNEAFSPPPAVIEGDNVERLTVLDWFSHCSVQMGDQMSYRIKNDDVISSVDPTKVFDPKTVFVKDAVVKVRKESDFKKPEEPVVSSVVSGTSIEKDVDDGDDAEFEDIEDGDKSELLEKNSANCSGRGGRKKCRIKCLVQRHKGKLVQNQKQNNKKKVQKECPVKPDEVVQVEIELTTSWATVMWQDGIVERDIPSLELFPVHHLDDLEFFPGDFVLSTVDLPEQVDYGVVLKADHAERTCWIRWMKAYEVGKATAPTVIASNCEVSVYDITDHPDYKFRPGQSIVRIGGFEHLSADHGDNLQAIGQIYEMDANGHLVVKWANGTISQCFPQEVYIISEDMDDVSDNNSLESWASESDYETDGSGETWETESEDEIIGEESDEKRGKDDSGFDQGAICEHKQELDALLSRAETALFRLQKLLNVFDISTVSVPECFHDIIRIYRSCHDLDKILQSSFFIDPELQSLISQAKKELRRDKANKISKHLSQLFEAWNNSLPAEEGENVGRVSFDGKTILVGVQREGADIEVSLQVPTGERDSCDTSFSLVISGAAGGGEVTKSADTSVLNPDSSVVSDSCDETNKSQRLKESGESAVSDFSRSETSDRRSSDPSNISSALGTKNKKKNKDINLVGENCVTKANKRTKSDGCDDSGHEAKKSKDESNAANHVAQELCYKICQNLQKQILKIHEEVNKRTKRLMNAAVKHNNVVSEDSTNVKTQPSSNLTETGECDRNEDSVEQNGIGHGDKEHNLGQSGASKHNHETEDSVPSLSDAEEKFTDDEKSHLKELNAAADGDVKVKNLDHQAAVDVDEGSSEVLASNSSQKEEATITLEDVKAEQIPCKGFDMYGEAQSFHTYVSRESQPANPRAFRTAVKRELKLFQTSLPDGIFIKGFEDRLDLYSVMILGPAGTPYEDALFLFDMMLPNDYPNAPPLCQYHSYCSDRLNPNLYEDGKVCVSLLGTWAGKGTEVWTSKSNLLQVLVSIQGLILVSEPYYNEAGYERQRGTQVGQENSRMYNEMAILKTVQSLTKMCSKLPTLFREEIYRYLTVHGPRLIARLRHWMHINECQKKQQAVFENNSSQRKETQLPPQPDGSSVSRQENVGEDTNSIRHCAPSNDKTLPIGLHNNPADLMSVRDEDVKDPSPNEIQTIQEDGNIQNTSDNIDLQTIQEDCNIQNTSDNIDLQTIQEDGNICNTSDNIDLQTIQEDGNIRNTSDNIDLQTIQEDGNIQNTSDNIDLQTIQEDGNIQNTSDNIDLQTIQEDGNIQNTSDNIDLQTIQEDGNIQNTSDNIDLQTLQEDGNIRNTSDDMDLLFNETIQAINAVHISSDLELPFDHMNAFANMNGQVTTVDMSKSEVSSNIDSESVVPQPSNGGSSVDGNLTLINAAVEGSLLGATNSKENIKRDDKDRDLINSALGQCLQESQINSQPDFPLFPMSRGFCLTLQKYLNLYEKELQKMEAPLSS